MKQSLNCVLVIDDDEPTNFFTNMIIEESGYSDTVRVAQNGQEALDYLQISEAGSDRDFPSPDLILLDINMPAMNGWEFLEEYRRKGIYDPARVIIVMLTTSLLPADIEKANQLPEISGFENKPLTPENFEKIILKHFGTHPSLRSGEQDSSPRSE